MSQTPEKKVERLTGRQARDVVLSILEAIYQDEVSQEWIAERNDETNALEDIIEILANRNLLPEEDEE